MKNITVSVDEETHRMARIRAAQLDTSVSALVRNYLRTLGEDDSPREETAADDGQPGDAVSDEEVRRNVERLYAEARARASAVNRATLSGIIRNFSKSGGECLRKCFPISTQGESA